MHNTIAIEQALILERSIYIDMRSPSEYLRGHIPGAVSIPLFTDQERAQIGIIYKTIGVEKAKQDGLEIVSTKLPQLVGRIREHYRSGYAIIVYCWRGGMRSKSIVTILELMGIKAFQLLGGYKSYRRYVLEVLENFKIQPRIVVLCGPTGVGKTTLLNKLSLYGIPTIDLEKIANHRGSVFGQVGLGQATTSHSFDAALLEALQRFNGKSYIVVECESRRIGNVFLPNVLYQAMQRGIKILLQTDIQIRIDRLLDEYVGLTDKNSRAILAGIKSLSKRIGNNKIDKMLSDYSAGQVNKVVYKLLTDYYDPLYGYENANLADYDYVVNADDLEKAAEKIIAFLDK